MIVCISAVFAVEGILCVCMSVCHYLVWYQNVFEVTVIF